jgi:putative transcriptional regulator
MESMTRVLRQARARRMAARTDRGVSSNKIQRARKRLGLSQEQFTDVFDVTGSTLHKWKQGKHAPSAAAKALLKVIALEPTVVLRALAII